MLLSCRSSLKVTPHLQLSARELLLYMTRPIGGRSSYEMVLKYAHLLAEHLADHAEALCRPKALPRTLSGTPGTEVVADAA